MKTTALTVTALLLISLNGCGGGAIETSSTNTSSTGNTPSTYTPTPTPSIGTTTPTPTPTTSTPIPTPTPTTSTPIPTPTNTVYSYEYFAPMNGSSSTISRYSGTGVTIGVLEIKPFDLSHPEFKDLDILNRDSYTASSYSSHANSMLSIIGSSGIKMNGITKGASFVLGHQGVGTNTNTENYNRMDNYGVSVVNNSWGGKSLERDTIATINNLTINGNRGKGIVFIFALGNENQRKDVLYGDIDDNLLIVGALTSRTLEQSKNYPDQKQIYSNYGYSADIFVYDEFKVTADLDGGYQKISGTSSATAVMTSVIAMAQEIRPDLKASVLMELVCSTATKIEADTYPYDFKDINGNMRSSRFGCGKLNVDGFLSGVLAF